MMSLADELRAERALSPAAVWDAAEARLDRPVEAGLNTAHEACDRWQGDRGRLALIVSHPDGRSERWTYAELSRASRRFANALKAAGLHRGDRFAAVLTRQVETQICCLAAWRAGLIYTPMFVGFGPDALAARLNAADVPAVVVDYRYRDLLEQARALVRRDMVVFSVAGPGGRGIYPGDRSVWSEIDRYGPDFHTARTTASDPATLIFTSGTTGAPKGCIQPHSLVLGLQPFLRHTFALQGPDMLFAGADPGWSYGLYTTGAAVMALGACRVIHTGDFEPRAWLDVLEREQVTYVSAAPTAYRQVAQAARRYGLASSVRGATSAGEPLDAALVSSWQAIGGGDLQDSYGQSESGMLLANLAFEQRAIVPGSLSSVVPGFDVALVDERGEPAESQGILALHQPRYQASVGYWNDDDRWRERWRGDWFLTGDIFRRGDSGGWCFVGRADDLIITSGYNVGPAEVESIILEQPGVADVAVVAAPDPRGGVTVRAVIVPDGSVGQDRLTISARDSVRARLGRHAYPRVVDFAGELPRTETGKLRRNVLRDSYQPGQAG